jgi:hypothetical protein
MGVGENSEGRRDLCNDLDVSMNLGRVGTGTSEGDDDELRESEDVVGVSGGHIFDADHVVLQGEGAKRSEAVLSLGLHPGVDANFISKSHEGVGSVEGESPSLPAGFVDFAGLFEVG